MQRVKHPTISNDLILEQSKDLYSDGQGILISTDEGRAKLLIIPLFLAKEFVEKFAREAGFVVIFEPRTGAGSLD